MSGEPKPTGDRYVVEYYGRVNGRDFGPETLDDNVKDSASEVVFSILGLIDGWYDGNGITEVLVTRFNTSENTSRDVSEDMEPLLWDEWLAQGYSGPDDFENVPRLLQGFKCVNDDPDYKQWRADSQRADYEYERGF